jgi:D-3-phosphoglycerate dehydrogenase
MIRMYRPRVRIAEPENFSPAALEILDRHADVELEPVTQDNVELALADCDVLWFRLGLRFDERLIRQATRCSVLATPVTGLDKIDLEACHNYSMRVLSLRGEYNFLNSVRATSELTVGLTLSLLRNIPAATTDVTCGHWDRDSWCGRELFGSTVGIVGCGRIGRHLAQYYRAFGMNVIGYDPRPDFPHDLVQRVETLDELMQTADVVSVHVAYNASTRHLIGRREIDQMKRSAVLINTARGGLIDEQALADAIRDGRIAGAAVDVIDGEPNIESSPLVALARSTNRMLVTPHIGGKTYESCEKTEVFMAQKVVEALTKPANLVPVAA